MEQLKEREAKLQEEEEARKAKEKKDGEYDEFLKAYPEVEVEKIPIEIFENAKKSTLLNAYREYENKILKEKIKQMEQNQKNASSSVVTPTSDGSVVEQQGKDAFIEGFDSVE